MLLPDLITRTRTLARTLSGMAALGIGRRETYDEILHQTLCANPEVYGIWSVWEPGALDGRDRHFRDKPGHDATGRFIPFWFHADGAARVEPNTNYERPGIGDYYLIPRETRRERTIRFSPYVDCSGRRHDFTCHIVPLIHGDRFVGVVGIDALPQTIERSPDSAHPPLSAREQEVLEWIAAGKSNSEIGTILGISPHTAKHHVARVIAKLGVENRRAAMLAYLDAGLTAA